MMTNLTLEQENEELRAQISELKRRPACETILEAVEPVELDKYEIAIRDYIGDNLGTTENKIRIEMDKKQNGQPSMCSPLTTRKKIKHLLELGIIDDRKEGNTYFHKLYLNDKSEFHRINKQLSKIEFFVNSMDEPIAKRWYQQHDDDSLFDTWFKVQYQNAIDSMLSVLLSQLNNEKLSKNDYRELSTKIVNLALKLRLQMFSNPEEMEAINLLDLVIVFFEEYKQKLSKKSEDQIEMGVNKQFVDNLISYIESFKTDFLQS